jgi:hypothetical protein
VGSTGPVYILRMGSRRERRSRRLPGEPVAAVVALVGGVAFHLAPRIRCRIAEDASSSQSRWFGTGRPRLLRQRFSFHCGRNRPIRFLDVFAIG